MELVNGKLQSKAPLPVPEKINLFEFSIADLDGNGKVEFADFLVLSANFGKEFPDTASVPEPTSSFMLCLAGLLIARLRPRRR